VREPIDVEPQFYDAASKVFGEKVYIQLLNAGEKLEGALAGTGAMAGSDPAGVQWAASYDEAARGGHAVLIDLETACLKIAVMLQQTGFNHGMADSASDPTKSAPTPADPGVYLPGKRAAPDLPSARGGSADPPAGWWLIEHTVGYLWPNGHPDKLRPRPRGPPARTRCSARRITSPRRCRASWTSSPRRCAMRSPSSTR
jgi:hypothetical protein